MKRKNQKKELIQMLAHFLVDDQAAKSIALQMDHQRPANDPRPQLAAEWAGLRASSGLHGYPTYEEALDHLEKLLS